MPQNHPFKKLNMKSKNPLLAAFALLMCINLSASEHKSISKTVNSLNVSIDSRQELISIVQYLGGYFRLNKLKLVYKTDIDTYFSDFKEHEAVKYVQKMTKQGFTYDAPPTAMLYFSHKFEVEKEFSEYLHKRAGGADNLDEFARLMKKFAEETDFNTFFESQQEFYKQTINDFTVKLSDFKEVETIESFYGKKQNSYNIILSCLNSGNYGPSINSEKGTDIYSIMSAKKVSEGKPLFGSLKNIEYLVWHEFGHSFVNYLTLEQIDLVSKYESLNEPIKIPMKRQAYGSWETVVNEHVIRAITIKLAENKYGLDVANDLMFNELGRSFIYIEPILTQLDDYMNNRDSYALFSDFYPLLIENSFNLALTTNYQEKYLKNLNNTFKDIDFIVVSKSATTEVSDYIKDIKNKFFKDTPLITDKEAIEKDLSEYSFLIYGTIENNLLLQNIKSNLPIQILDSSIDADKEYKTHNGKAIFNMKNPFNTDEYIIVYTAQNPEGIIGINDVFHGPTNYIVFEDRNNIYSKGFVVKENDKWICK